jgi:imidazolonepropionase-like amidohydrolase
VFTPTWCLGEGLKRAKAPANVLAKWQAAAKAKDGMFKRALAKGVKIAFGSDAGVCAHGEQIKQFSIMVGLGMKPLAALRSATSVDANLLGIDGPLGPLVAGKVADVMAGPGHHHGDREGVLRDEGGRRLPQRR